MRKFVIVECVKCPTSHTFWDALMHIFSLHLITFSLYLHLLVWHHCFPCRSIWHHYEIISCFWWFIITQTLLNTFLCTRVKTFSAVLLKPLTDLKPRFLFSFNSFIHMSVANNLIKSKQVNNQ